MPAGTARILFSNLGYARGIDGSLWHHASRFKRNFYTGRRAQLAVLAQVRAMLDDHEPDLCCFVEIDSGSVHSHGLNQLTALREGFVHHDIAGKYGPAALLGRLPLHQGKSNAFIARDDVAFERLYFAAGSKKLVYRIRHPAGFTIYFAHFSLHAATRAAQLTEMRRLVDAEPGESMVLADFNIMQGFRELAPLTAGGGLHVLNQEAQPTFTFHRRRLALDLCLCTPALASRGRVTVIPQPYSDHAALLVEIDAKAPE